MAYKDRTAFLQVKNKRKNAPGFKYDNMILLDGQIIGSWRRDIKQHSMTVALQFVEPLNKHNLSLLEKAIDHSGEFTGLRVDIEKAGEINSVK